MLPLNVLPDAYYECRDCGRVWKIPPDPPATVDDLQDSSIEHVDRQTPACPNCLTLNGQPFQIEDGPGYRRLSYYCENCQYMWGQPIYLSPKAPPR